MLKKMPRGLAEVRRVGGKVVCFAGEVGYRGSVCWWFGEQTADKV